LGLAILDYNQRLRRILAISLVLSVSFPLICAVLPSGMGDANLPACCRRDGKHHCMMRGMENLQGSRITAVSEKCPCGPFATARVILPRFAPATAQAVFANLARHPAGSPQTEAQYRISFDRARQKRGPPAALVAS
jgi:hypothetical protein